MAVTNRSRKPIVAISVLVATKQKYPLDGNRVFESAVSIAPGETRTIEARATDSTRYLFKAQDDERNGCELDYVKFADGTSWEQPTPL